MGHYKDKILADLATRANIAQFVSYAPDLTQRYSCVAGYPINHCFSNFFEAAQTLLHKSPEKEINIRTFNPSQPKSWPLIRGLKTPEEAYHQAKELTGQGLHIILHEEISDDIGKTSCVLLGDLIEFAPQTTPRCVEPKEIAIKGYPASLPKEVGRRLLEKVYGFAIPFDFSPDTRVEFTVLSTPYGHRLEHLIVWELEEVGTTKAEPLWQWPNRFSRFIGDKTYGLLLADCLGLPVPRTQVIGRNAHFNFGTPTGSPLKWTRTAPIEQTPGKFLTQRGYTDPFNVMTKEDPEGKLLAAVLVQDEISAHYSGALIGSAQGVIIEGVKGFGDKFMLGERPPEPIPQQLTSELRKLHDQTHALLGPTRMEWVYDGNKSWVVQLHRGAVDTTSPHVIVQGNPSMYERFELNPNDLDGFTKKVEKAKAQGIGLEVVGEFGITSHVGDILRKAGVPSRRVSPNPGIKD